VPLVIPVPEIVAVAAEPGVMTPATLVTVRFVPEAVPVNVAPIDAVKLAAA